MDIILKRLFSFIVVFFVGVSMFAGGTIKNVKKKAVDTQMTDETAALLYNTGHRKNAWPTRWFVDGGMRKDNRTYS